MRTQKAAGISRILYNLLILALVIVMIPAMPGEAASRKSKALAAYKKMLSRSTVTVVPEKIRYRRRTCTYAPANAKNVMFTTAYIDNDDIPELILWDLVTDNWGIWTYRNGKVAHLYHEFNFGDHGYYSMIAGFYRKKGIFRTISIYPGGYDEDFCKIVNGKVKDVLSISNDGKEFLEDYYCMKDKAYTKISKGKFNKMLRTYVGSTKMSRLVMHTNTARNRSKNLK